MLGLVLVLACEPPSVATTGTDDSDDSSIAESFGWRLDDEIESLIWVSWDQPRPATVHVEYEVDGLWRSTPPREVEAGEVEQLVLGVPYDDSVEVRVVRDDGSGPETSETQRARTGDLPAGFPRPELLSSTEALQEPTGNWLLGSVNSRGGGWNDGEYWMWIIDREGRVVWAMPGDSHHFTIYLQTSLDDDILWDVSTYWSNWDDGAASQIHRMKLDGVVTETIDAPGMHHAFIEMPDRSILWGSALTGNEKLLRQDTDGSQSTVWDCAGFYAEQGLDDWCHTNSIWLDGSRDTLVLSFPTTRTFVLEVDVATGEELRWFGYVPGSWSFEPPESAFVYQHGVTYTPEGTLLVSSQVDRSSYEGVVREYAVDEDDQVLREVWSHGEGDGITARYAGEAHRLPGGNTLHNTGTTPRVREITPEGEVAWDLSFDGDKLIGRTTWLEDLYTYAP